MFICDKMNKKIVFLRCSTVNEDVRLRKYLIACENEGIEYSAFTWDRLNKNNFVKNEIPFKHYSPYGLRWKNFGSKISWQLFLIWNLLKKRTEFDVVHACDFDTMIPALLYRLFSGGVVIYDIYDCFSSSASKLSFLQWIIRKVDLFLLKQADLIILADCKRIKQMELPESYRNKILIIENVPQTDFSEYIDKKLDLSKILLSYVGVFDHHRGIENILKLVEKNPRLTLDIAGEGALKSDVVEASKRCARIKYWGFVNYSDGLKLMQRSNFILGMYYKSNPEHYFAAPNKYFESLLLRVPLITTKGTLLGDKVSTFNTGYVLGETLDDLNEFFDEMIENGERFHEDYKVRESNCKALWQDKYINYNFEKLQKEYLSRLFG